MATYKIGNQVIGIIRSCSAGKLGAMSMQFSNQPYTILKDISVTLTFDADNKSSEVSDKTILGFNHDTLNEIRLSNVPLNDKILELIYQENVDEPLYSKRELCDSDNEGHIYLSTNGEIYQVFIYDEEGNLEAAYGTYNGDYLTVNKPNSSYSIYYSFLGTKSFLFDKTPNIYVSLDLITIGNEDDGTQDMMVHINKCLIRADKALYFNRGGANTIDLTAQVIHTNKDYITIK